MDTLSTKLAISRSAMQSATCPLLTLPWAPLSLGPSGNRVSRFRSAWILCPRDPRFPDPRWPDGRPPVGTFPDGSDHCHASQEWTVLIASRCFGVFDTNVPMSTEFPIRRSPTFFGSPTRVLNGWTVQVKPRTLPNANPKALICVSPDGSNVDDSPMVATCPNQMDGSDCIGVFTMDSPTSCSQNSRFADSLQISATCLTLMDGPDLISLFRDLKCPDFLDLVNPDFTNVDIPMPSHISSGFLLLYPLRT
jgi:hypothetical protein